MVKILSSCILFPNSVNILVTTSLHFLSVKIVFFLISSVVLSRITNSSASHFLKFLCCVKLGERVTCCDLEGVSLHKSIPYSLCAPSAFGARAGFDVSTSHVFLQGMLAAITFGSMRRGLWA